MKVLLVIIVLKVDVIVGLYVIVLGGYFQRFVMFYGCSVALLQCINLSRLLARFRILCGYTPSAID